MDGEDPENGPRRARDPALAVLFLAGAALRLTGLSVHSLWIDETMTWHVASSGHVVRALAGDRHPPLSFLAFEQWRRLAGDSEAALRLLPALVACLALALFAVLARELLARRPARVAVALFAVSPFQVWHGQEVRMYAFLGAASLLAFVGAAGAGRRPPAATAALVFLGVALALGFHYMGLLVLFAVLAFLGVRRGPTVAVAAPALLGAAVWVPWWVRVVPGQLDTAWGHTARLSLRDLAELPARLVLVEMGVLAGALEVPGWVLGGLLLLGFAAGCWGALRPAGTGGTGTTGTTGTTRGGGGPERAALALFAAPLLAALLLATVLPPNFTPRYLTAAAPGAVLLAGAGFARLRPPGLGLALAGLAVLGCLAVTLLHKSGNRREDFRAAVAEVAERWREGDRLLVVTGIPAYEQAPARYYLRDRPDVLAGLVTWEQVEAVPGRLHVVHRRARYSAARATFLRQTRELVEESPVRFRVVRMLFDPR